MRYVVIVSLIFGLHGCSYDRFDDPPQKVKEHWQANATVRDVREIAGSGTIRENMILECVVASSDSAGNFYKQLVVEDLTGGMTMRLGMYDLYRFYGRGALVAIRMQGLAAAYDGATLVVGYAGVNGVEEATSAALILPHMNVQGSGKIRVTDVKIKDITASMVGRTLRVRGRFLEGGKGTYAGEARFTDPSGSIMVYTSAYAMFARDILPYGEVELVAIVCSYGKKLQLQISSPDS